MKWDLSTMRIGTRMAANVAIVVLLMGVALFQYHVAIQDIEERYKFLLHVTGQIKEHVSIVRDLLQKASIGDKNFELSRDLAHARSVLDSLKKADDELSDMEFFERSMNDNPAMGETRKLKDQVSSLHKLFSTYQKGYEKRGLTLDTGSMGQMRAAAHAMEERFLRIENPIVQVHYLTMRRQEKDYLLRNDKTNFENAKRSSEILRNDVNEMRVGAEEKGTLSGLLDSYMRTLEATVAESDALKGINDQVEESFVLLDKGLSVKEKATDKLMEETERDTLVQVHATQSRAAATSGVAVLVAILTAVFFVNSIRKLLIGVASNLSASASQIAAAINEQDRISNLQASSVNETNTTMEELGSSSRQSSEQAESAASNAQKALEAAEHGMSRVEDMVMGMNVTKTKVDAIAQQILRLSEQTSQISTITGTVTDFANETKMLAMNAAVEAVRAGEHGKGFSVLAVEIRKLAEESKRSAERINSLVVEIQKATNATVMATEEGGKTVDQGMMVAQNTAEAFAEVSEAVNNASQSSQQISLNVRQQAVAIRQVVEAMKSINTGAKETAAGISQIKSGTHVLNDAAGQLKSMI